MLKFINFNKHAVSYQNPSGDRITIPASGKIAEVDSTPQTATELETEFGPMFFGPAQVYGEVYLLVKEGDDFVKEPFPPQEEGTVYIVGGLVAERLKGRVDVCSPGTGPKDGPIRFKEGTQKGNVEAVTRWNWAPL